MKKELYNKLFDFDINKYKKISVTKNEIYNQLLLYIFFSCKKNILIVMPTLNEANELYNELKNYIDEVYLFPEDDFMSKKSIAASPELLFMRVKLLNKINDKEKKIVICHLNSFIKKLPSKKEYENKKIELRVNSKINRKELISNLINIGYKKESIVYNTSEFSVRGFVIDIFPINEENPIRIELFDDEIEKIKYFDIKDQKSIKEIDNITIGVIKDEDLNNNSTIRDYIDNSYVIFNNINQIKAQEKMIMPQIKYLNIQNEIFSLSKLIEKDDIYFNTIDNKNCDLIIKSSSIEKYNLNKEKFLEDIIRNKGLLFTKNEKLIKEFKNIVKIEKNTLNNGFVYNNMYFYSENNLFNNYITRNNIKEMSIGSKISSIDSLNIGDYVVHRKSGIGIYRGLTTIEKNGIKKDYLLIQYKGNDKLYMPVEDISKLYKYSSKEGTVPTINKLNSIEWTKTKLKIKERIKNITGELLKIYKERNKASVVPFKPDDENQILFENEFEYEETVDQLKVSDEIKKDLEKIDQWIDYCVVMLVMERQK